ncbi:hypothetical protein DXX93_11580 [Thalassotalea euphylliae]|uniref:Uncharacterized protein n=1 Tax=Thalassotalea euphylliae TaxID=1655234 RepID=A0A3E0TRM0_9GAMM|nr:hypothetical protein DXX93_11580 [Thalassotalea euphylliae]
MLAWLNTLLGIALWQTLILSRVGEPASLMPKSNLFKSHKKAVAFATAFSVSVVKLILTIKTL